MKSNKKKLTPRLSTKQRKIAMVEALKKTLGIVTSACKIVGIDNQTHYAWLKQDEDYKTQVEEIKNMALDFAESKLHEIINQNNPTGIIFYLKCKGKDRGYIDIPEIKLDGKIDIEIVSNKNGLVNNIE